MFFLNFLIFLRPAFDNNFVLKFQYFPEEEGDFKKKTVLKKFFSITTNHWCHFFRYSFPIKTSGTVILGKESPLDCVFETKSRVRVLESEPNFLIGRLNAGKGTFVAVNFFFKMEKKPDFSSSLFEENPQVIFDRQNKIYPGSRRLNFIIGPGKLVKKKNPFSLCWSISRVSTSVSSFFFDIFINFDRNPGYFQRLNLKSNPLNQKFQLSSKRKIIRRIGLYIYRASFRPLGFPVYLFNQMARFLVKGIYLIFFSLGFFLDEYFHLSLNLIKPRKILFLDIDIMNLLFQKKRGGKKINMIDFPFSSKFFLDNRAMEKTNFFTRKSKGFFKNSSNKYKMEIFSFLKTQENCWNNELSLSELKINFLSKRIKIKNQEKVSIWSFFLSSLKFYLNQKEKKWNRRNFRRLVVRIQFQNFFFGKLNWVLFFKRKNYIDAFFKNFFRRKSNWI